jgi:major vault protein
VKNYVGLLCDHLGSILRSASRGWAIEPFYAGATDLLRTAVLGDKKDGPRAGRLFEENGMWVYDVEVLEVKILDPDVKKLLADAQRAAIVAEVGHRDEERRLAGERLRASVDMQIAEAQTAAVSTALQLDEARAEANRRRTKVAIELDRLERVGRAESEASARGALREAEALGAERMAEIEKKKLEARVAAFEKQMAAFAPELIATLKTLGHQQLAASLAEHVGPLAILGGGSVSDIVEKLLGQLPVGVRTTVAEAIKANGNGKPPVIMGP